MVRGTANRHQENPYGLSGETAHELRCSRREGGIGVERGIAGRVDRPTEHRPRAGSRAAMQGASQGPKTPMETVYAAAASKPSTHTE